MLTLAYHLWTHSLPLTELAAHIALVEIWTENCLIYGLGIIATYHMIKGR